MNYLLRSVPESLWSRCKHYCVDHGMTLRQLIFAALDEKMRSSRFSITHPGDQATGINGFSDEVSVFVESDDPGGETEDWEEFLIDILRYWYVGAKVEQITHDKRGGI